MKAHHKAIEGAKTFHNKCVRLWEKWKAGQIDNWQKEAFLSEPPQAHCHNTFFIGGDKKDCQTCKTTDMFEGNMLNMFTYQCPECHMVWQIT